MKKFTLIFTVFIAPAIVLGQSDAQKAKNTVDKATIKNHIYYLASDKLKGRETGTPGMKKAADYLAEQLHDYGVEPVPGANDYYQAVSLISTSPPKEIMVEIGKKALENHLLLLSGGNIEQTGKGIFLNYGLAEDYEGQDVNGKIVIVKAGGPGQTTPGQLLPLALKKRGLAQAAGATVLIELYSFDPQYWGYVSGHFSHKKMSLENNKQEDMVHLWGNTGIEVLQGRKVGDQVDINVEVQGREIEKVTSRNVVGMVPGTDPELKDEYIIYSAHYDHIGVGKPNVEGDSIYNGARDNAVGTVTVLSAAKNIARYPTKRSALFILFTAEEKGLLGSKWYVEHPLIPLHQMVYCFNSDNASYNDTTVATIVGLERTTAAEHFKAACAAFGLTAIDDPAPEQNLFDRSDNVHFAIKGIPAPTFSLGFTAFDEEVFKYYHQVTDNPETLNYNYLLKFFRSYVLACRKIANAEQRPFWIKGDKYYQAGLELYEK